MPSRFKRKHYFDFIPWPFASLSQAILRIQENDWDSQETIVQGKISKGIGEFEGTSEFSIITQMIIENPAW